MHRIPSDFNELIIVFRVHSFSRWNYRIYLYRILISMGFLSIEFPNLSNFDRNDIYIAKVNHRIDPEVAEISMDLIMLGFSKLTDPRQ